jgi:hypothetical protein
LGPFPLRSDCRCDLLQRFGREHGAHLSVARLVAPLARDRPELGEQTGPVAADGELSAIEPLDAAGAPGDDREAFAVRLHSEPVRLRKGPELLDGLLL